MRSIVIAALMLLVSACASARAGANALGYPINVDHNEGQCRFLIQDMWMSEVAMVDRWLAALPAKADQIDLVWGDNQDRRCIPIVRESVERAGFTHVVIRRGSPEDYPDLLRRTAPNPSVR